MVNNFIFLPIGLTLLAAFATAQQKQEAFAYDTSFVVKAGTKLNDAIPARYVYRYAEFLPGKVVFRDGTVSEARMNYNRLTDEMHFINRPGDTLALADEPTVRFICIGKDSFCFDRGYVLLVKSDSDVKLGMKQGFQLGDRKRPTGYDMMSSTSSVTGLSSLHDGRKLYELEVKEQVLVTTVTQFYFGDKYNHFVFATGKNLRGLFPECKRPIEEFCKKSGIDFGKREDLESVVSFMAGSCR